MVRDLNVAREIGIGRVRMVTLAGDVLETSGSMKGGYRDTEKKRRLSFAHGDSPYRLQSGVAKDQEDLEEARRRADEGEIAYERAQEELRELLSRTQIVTNQVSILGVQKQNSERELSGLEQEMSFSNLAPEQFDAQKTILAEKKKQLDAEIEQLEKNLRTAAGRLEEFNDAQEQKKKRIFSLQENMQSLQGELNKIVEERNLKQMEAVRVETKLENLAHEAYQETGTSLELIREKGVEILPEAEIGATQEKVQKLKYQLSLIGGIDEEVVKEYEETKSKHDILTDQLTDLKAALGDLEQLTEELDEVMRKKRKRGFAQIRKEFARYFGLLFEGGKADLVELYGEKADLVLAEEDEEVVAGEDLRSKNTNEKILVGIEIQACPPGKKIRNIQALSGGERTMTAIALICAVLHTNPSPFVVLDEVEAALDEANSQKFASILLELASRSQFIIITHNRVTMHAADALYGVTMGNEGVSHLLSVKLDH